MQRTDLISESLCTSPPTDLYVPVMVRGFVLETNTPVQHPPHGSWFQAGQAGAGGTPLMLD